MQNNGTVIEEGELSIIVKETGGSSKYEKSVRMIEESEKLKSNLESKAEHLADRLVPYSLGATALTYALTRNTTKALSILMVDFSCALKLAMPLSVLSAIKEAEDMNISVKGGKYLEAVAEAVISSLNKAGFSKIVMMTGDSERTATAIAKQVGVEEYCSEVLPEDKARFIKNERASGRRVIMIGDGINDSPALSAADAGIAVSDGAELAREIADITIGADNLYQIVLLKMISDRLMKKDKQKLPYNSILQCFSHITWSQWSDYADNVGTAA